MGVPMTPTLDAAFPPAVRAQLLADLAKGPVIRATTAQAAISAMNIEIGTLMIMLLPTAAAYARVPISNFHVGAVALGAPPGSLYLGANLEFTGQALSFCVHGEQCATNNAWLNGETYLQAIAINAAPCGYCRQFLYETTTGATGLNILLKANSDPNDYSYTMDQLTSYLPNAFGPGDLGITDRLMQPEAHGLSIPSTDPLATAALQAANASYSPYTADFCGVAVQMASGTIYAGRYAENAAYNPSMSPLESALAFQCMYEPAQNPYAIVAAALVEAKGSAISQLSATQAVLSSVAPGIPLATYTAS